MCMLSRKEAKPTLFSYLCTKVVKCPPKPLASDDNISARYYSLTARHSLADNVAVRSIKGKMFRNLPLAEYFLRDLALEQAKMWLRMFPSTKPE